MLYRNRNKTLIITILIVAFLGTFYSHKYRAPKRNYSDFHCFYTAGKRILNQQNIYVLRDKEAAEFRYTPIFAVFMSGFALMDIDTADGAWFILNFCLLVAAFILMERLIIRDKLSYKTSLVLYLLVILGVLRFILHNFDNGQSNILMLTSIIMGLYYISKKREILGGAILAISTIIKYTPLIFILYFLVRRKIKLALITVAFLGIYLMLPSLFIGFKTNITYLKNMIPFLTQSTIFDQMTILDPKNQSLLSFFHRIFTNCVAYFHAPPMPFQSWNLTAAKINLIFAISAMAIYASILYAPKKARLTQENIYHNIDYTLLLICIVLFNLNAWRPTYLLLSMGYFIIVYYLINNEFKDKIMLILLILSYLLNIITIKSIVGKTFAYKADFYSPLTLSALITFFILLKIKILKNFNFKR